MEPFLEYKEVRYLWNNDEVSKVVCLVGLVHVQSAPDKLFLFVPFFEQTLFLELFFASKYFIIKILLRQGSTDCQVLVRRLTFSLSSLIFFRFSIDSFLR